MWSVLVLSNETNNTVCLGCLATDVELHDIYANNLADSFAQIVGVPLSNEPCHLCVFCRAQLRKSAAFRTRARRVQDALSDAGFRGATLSPEYIREIGQHLKHSYAVSAIKTLDVSEPDEQPEPEPEIKQEECDSDSDDYFLSTLGTSKKEEDAFDKDYLSDKDIDTDTDREAKTLSVFVEDVKKEVKKKRVQLKTVKQERRPKKRKTDEEIIKDVDQYNFDVVFLTRDEQIQEVTELKNREIKYMMNKNMTDKLHRKCELCGKNFKTKRSKEVHFKNYHDESIGHIVCDLCHCRFSAKNRFNTHMKIHRERFHCRNCDFVSNRECGLRKHYEYHQGKKYTCEYCKKDFAKVSSYMSHVRLIHASLLPWCELCGESFIGEKGIQAHKKRAHKNVEDPQFGCDQCKNSFMNEKALEKHKSLNRCNLSNCVHCGDAFASLQILKYHLVSRHGEVGSVTSDCGQCGVAFHSAAALARHAGECGGVEGEGGDGRAPCVQCGASFSGAEELAQHEEKEHAALNFFKCEECGRTFTNAYYFREHNARDHEHPRKMRAPKDTVKAEKAPRRHGCGRRLEAAGGVRTWRVLDERRLVMERRGLDGEVVREQRARDAVCEVCGKAFANVSLLKLHQRLHTGEKLFTCTYCGKKFNISTLLRNHMRVHTGERPFKCAECPKAFKEWAGYKRHHLSHTGVRRHVCEICQKTFLTSTCVKVHIRSVHMKIPMPPRVRKPRVKHE